MLNKFIKYFCIFNIFSIFIFCFDSNASSIYSNQQLLNIKKSVDYAEKKDWNKAYEYAKKTSDKTVLDAIFWLEILSNNGDFSFDELSDFYNEVQTWPNSYDILKIVENYSSEASNSEILEWYKTFQPITQTGKKVYLDNLYYAKKNNSLIKKLAQDLWINGNFNDKSEIAFLNTYGQYISQNDQDSRMDKLLWERKISDAKRQLKRCSKVKYEAFYQRLTLLELLLKNRITRPQILNIIRNQKNIGIIYDVLFFANKNKDEELVALIANLIPNKNPPYADKWWDLKNKQIRLLIEDNKYKLAYSLASNSQNKNLVKYIDSEWLAGWISYRYLKMPQTSISHFKNIYNNSKTSISLARGSYWCARAYESLNDPQNARIWFLKASKYPTTFYGQLAFVKLNMHEKFNVDDNIIPSKSDIENFKKNKFAKLAIIFSYLKNFKQSHDAIAMAVRKAKTKGEILLIAKIGIDIKKLDLSVQATKEASSIGVVLPQYSYPVIDVKTKDNVSKEFILALIRQESLFNVRAKSNVGALGLMQIMPSTASDIARNLKMQFDVKKLHYDHEYNMKFGIYYLNRLLKIFDGSYILTVAAYNAGEGNVRKWIKRFGDPRSFQNPDHVIDWIESVTFTETRNYIQRVIEATQLYRSIIENKGYYSTNILNDICHSYKRH